MGRVTLVLNNLVGKDVTLSLEEIYVVHHRLAPIAKIPVEIVFCGGMLAITLAIAWTTGLPFIVPTSASLTALGISAIFPIIVPLIWLSLVFLLKRDNRSKKNFTQILRALFCYSFVLWLYFHLKFWTHYINPTLYDPFYQQIDGVFSPIIVACIAVKQWLYNSTPLNQSFYQMGYFFMFVISFTVHAISSARAFREVFLAILFLQGLGVLAYMPFPALGPFLYDHSNLWGGEGASAAQTYMLGVYQAAHVGGLDWYRTFGQDHFTSALGAMPSLHAAAAYVFVWFANKYEKPLLILYLPMFAYILIAAIGLRWHYLIDLPVGIALAHLCIRLAVRVENVEERKSAKDATSPYQVNLTPQTQ